MKLAVFEQLKKCSEAAKNNTAQRVGELAEATIEVVEEIESKKADKPQYINTTIPIEGWQSDENIYPNYYDILLEGITENTRADIIILTESMDIAVNCGMSPITETFSGKIRVRAITVPTEEIVTEIKVVRE